MKSDIQIAQETKMERIEQIAASIGIEADDLELYGKYKAKISERLLEKVKDRPDGKLVLVTAINPTPAGEGKTTTTIGLAQALNRLGKKSIAALREPSLGPCMGLKGGAAGGGYAQVVPMEDINLHFTGDLHALTTANNLLASLIDNHIHQGNGLGIDTRRVVFKRALDLNDRALRNTVIGLGGKVNGYVREDGFQITVASEVMAILCLSETLEELKENLGKIIIGYRSDNGPVTAADLKAQGAMAALLKDAFKPNLVQTLEHTPALVHGGPFANIAHGCNSIRATKLALKLCDITVTEAGFGADLGAEKFFDIKCRKANLSPDAVVLVATLRALKYNGGVHKNELAGPNAKAVKKGFANLQKHIENLQKYKVPVIVTLNVFDTDTDEETEIVRKKCEALGADFALSEVWGKGGEGGVALAEKLINTLETKKSGFVPLYSSFLTTEQKIGIICKEIYGAESVKIEPKAMAEIRRAEEMGLSELPVCIAKTQYSLSDNSKLLGRPEGFEVTVREVRISAGAGFLVVLLGDIMTMPGLPKKPAAEAIDVTEDGFITGLF